MNPKQKPVLWGRQGRESSYLGFPLEAAGRRPPQSPVGWGQRLGGSRSGGGDSGACRTAGPRARASPARPHSAITVRGPSISAAQDARPDCPPPARVSPDRISAGRGRAAAPAAGRGADRPRCGVGEPGHRGGAAAGAGQRPL